MSREFRPGRAGARWPCTGAVSKLGISGPGHPLFCTYIPDDGVSFRASRVEPGMYASCAHISDSQKTRGYASQAAIRPPIQIEGLAGMLILLAIPPSLPDFFFFWLPLVSFEYHILTLLSRKVRHGCLRVSPHKE